MADFKQAVLWMKEGKRVLRSSSDGSMVWYSTVWGFIHLVGQEPTHDSALLTTDDFLAEDWEVSE